MLFFCWRVINVYFFEEVIYVINKIDVVDKKYKVLKE